MRYDPEPDSYKRNKVNVELDLSNYATRLDLNGVAGINPHMHEIFLQRYCMKWVPGDPLKEMIN